VTLLWDLQQATHVSQAINLILVGLSLAVVHEIVAKYSSSWAREGTCRALCGSTVILGDSIVWSRAKPSHLETIELRCHLEDCANINWLQMQGLGRTGDVLKCEASTF